MTTCALWTFKIQPVHGPADIAFLAPFDWMESGNHLAKHIITPEFDLLLVLQDLPNPPSPLLAL